MLREEKMGVDDDQALATHTKKDQSKREDQPHRRPKRFQKNYRSKRDHSNFRCFTYDEKGYPRNKGSTRTNKKKRHHAHSVGDDEPTRKRTR